MSLESRVEELAAAVASPRAPLSARANYWSLMVARTLSKNQELGKDRWERSVRPRLPMVDSPELLTIPRVRREDLTPALLKRATRSSTPVVFEGLIADSPAVQNWSVKFFRENYGDVTVPMVTRWQGENHFTVGEILDRFEGHPSSDQAPAVNNVTDLISKHPELREALPFAKIQEWTGERLHGAQAFIGAKDCGTNYHCANEFNFFMMISGEKDWYLVHPRHSMWVDPAFDTRSGTYAFAGFERRTGWDDRPQGVPVMHAHLKPGDVLLNLPWWWHLVRNRTNSIGVSTRWHRWRFRFKTQNTLFTLMQWLVPHQWGIVWNDYVRGGELTDDKFVKAFLSHHAHYD